MSNYDEYRLEEDNMKRDKVDKTKKKGGASAPPFFIGDLIILFQQEV